ncbi:MAG: hypothetical protein IZT57_02485, partial [Chloroflexi bacterium]|nr:hypothetical protein [Chloroflexota bacterium]
GLVGWGIYAFFAEDEMPLAVKLAFGAIGLGIIILLGIAIKDRINENKTGNKKGEDN